MKSYKLYLVIIIFAFFVLTQGGTLINAANVYKPASSSSSQSYGPGGQEEETYGDGINAESCLNVASGTYTINAGDDGIHSDYFLNVGESGASSDKLKVDIQQCYEGIEGATINFYSGDIDIAASDDAVNAANAANGDLSSYDFSMNIFGGDIYADATNGSDNDGLDSNGSINVYGGKVVSMSDSGGNAFDLESDFNIYGGTLLGLGAAPMDGELPSNASTQSWAIWSGSGQGGNQGGGPGGPGGYGGGPGGSQGGSFGGQTSSGSTNLSSSDQSKVALCVGSSSYSIGSSIGSISSNSKVAVTLNGSTEIVGTTAKTNASYVTFAGDINGSTTSTLTYNSNNSSNKTSTVSAATGESVTVAANTFSYDGYTFVEWNTRADGLGASYSAGDSFTLSSDAALYAVWKNNSQETNDLTASFDYDSGVKNITVFDTQDYTAKGTTTNITNVKDGDTGEIDNSGSGQVNFRINLSDGYEVDNISITEGCYKNLKDVSTDDSPNTYRITKITDNIEVYITTTKKSIDTDSDSDTDTDEKTYPTLEGSGFVFDNHCPQLKSRVNVCRVRGVSPDRWRAKPATL